MPVFTENQNAMFKAYFGRNLPGFEPKLSEKERAGLRIQERKPLPGDSTLVGLKKAPTVRELAIERGVQNGLWPRTYADSLHAGVERVEPSLLTPEQQKKAALIEAKIIPGAKRPAEPSEYERLLERLPPEARAEADSIRVGSKARASAKDPLVQLITLSMYMDTAQWTGTEIDPMILNLLRARMDALEKELIPKKKGKPSYDKEEYQAEYLDIIEGLKRKYPDRISDLDRWAQSGESLVVIKRALGELPGGRTFKKPKPKLEY